MIPEKEITYFKSRLADYLYLQHNITNLKKFFHCLNPNHIDNNPSMSYSSRYNICKCFACGVRYDIYDLIEIDYNINSFRDKYNKLTEFFNELDKKIPIISFKEENYIEKDYKKYFDLCFKKILYSNYLNNRGIKNDLLFKYKIGYDDDRKLIIFPLNNHSYFARSTISNDKYKSKGTSYLFNEDLIKYSDENTIIYITESIIDSLSLESIISDIKTISLNGISNINRLISLSKEYEYKGIFILAFDNDIAGCDAQKKLKSEFDKLHIKAFCNTLISSIDDGNYKDINEALIKNKMQLIRNLNYFNDKYKIILDKINFKRGDVFEIQ